MDSFAVAWFAIKQHIHQDFAQPSRGHWGIASWVVSAGDHRARAPRAIIVKIPNVGDDADVEAAVVLVPAPSVLSWGKAGGGSEKAKERPRDFNGDDNWRPISVERDLRC